MLEDFLNRRCRSFVAYVLGILLVVPSFVSVAASEKVDPSSLYIEVLQGEEGISQIGRRCAEAPVVQVTDAGHLPVAGAAVVFTLPKDGPTGTFSKGTGRIQATTDSNGRATARRFRANEIPGRYQMQVEASYRGTSTKIMINQTNVFPPETDPGKMSGRVISVILGIAALVAGIVVVTTQNGGPSGIE